MAARDWDQGDLFGIPLLDGASGVGQVIDGPGDQPGTALCLFTARRLASPSSVSPIFRDEALAVLRVSATALDSGTWPVLGLEQLPRLRPEMPGGVFPTEPVHDPAIAEALVNACLGLYPWDGFADRSFFDDLLIPGRSRPETARTTGQMS